MRSRTSIAVLIASSFFFFSACKKPGLPGELSQLPRVKLGMSSADFLAAFSAKELDRTEKGIRSFDLNSNALPGGVSAARALFVENQLACVEARLAGTGDWTPLVTAFAKDFGVARPLRDSLGLERLELLRAPTESAGWADATTALGYGRDADSIVAVLLQKDQLAKVQGDVAFVLTNEKRTAEADAEEKRKVEEAKRIEDEAKRSEDEARATAPAQVKVDSAPLSCRCLAGGKIAMKCQVSNQSRFEIAADLEAKAVTGFMGRPAQGTGSIRVGANSSQVLEIQAQIVDGAGAPLTDACGSAAECSCRSTSVAVAR